MKSIIILGLFICFSAQVFAHGGDDHDGPANVEAPKGGLIKGLEDSYIEVVSTKKDVKIYTYGKDLKPALASAFNMTALVEMPRSKKQEKLLLVDKGHHLEATVDAKGQHRYTLILNLKQPTANHGDSVKFTIEPRK